MNRYSMTADMQAFRKNPTVKGALKVIKYADNITAQVIWGDMLQKAANLIALSNWPYGKDVA